METQLDYLGHEVESFKSPHAKQAVTFFNHLTKAVKAKLVYPSSSKLPEQFKNELLEKLPEIFTDIASLDYKISSNSIEYGDQVVYESSSRAENFAYLFFRDGLTNLRFSADIDNCELVRFIELLARILRTVYIDDDLATLLWEENFQYITYDLIDDGLDIDTIEYSPDDYRSGNELSKTDIESVYVEEGEIVFSEDDFVQAEHEIGLRQKGQAYRQMSPESHDFLNRISEITDEEKAEIAVLVAEDGEINNTEYLLTIIFEILGAEVELPGYTETLNFIGKVLDNFIDQANFAGATKLMARLEEMQEGLAKLNNPRAEKIANFFLECAAGDKINRLTEAVNKHIDIDADGLVEYLKFLPWAVIDPLVSSLGELKHFKGRKAFCDALTELGQGHVDLVARGLDDERWFVVRNVVMILGQIGAYKILGHLKKTIRHPDYRVRKETLKAAGLVRSDENVDFMILALSDADHKIQMSSLNYLIEHKVTRAFKAVEHIVKDKKFKDRPSEQVKRFLEAYAALGQDHALPFLKPLAGKSLFLASSKDERMKFLAISALGYVKTNEGRKFLNRLGKTKKNKVSAAVMRALHSS